MVTPKKKKKSGAQNRRARREREDKLVEVAAAAADLGGAFVPSARAKSPVADDETEADPSVNEQFEALGPPPKDIAAALPWARRHIALALHLVATRPSPAVIARARLIKELADSVGRTHDRGEIERRLTALERKRSEKSGPAGGMEKYDAASISRPASARGRSRGGPERG